jgi:hypothetical protein
MAPRMTLYYVSSHYLLVSLQYINEKHSLELSFVQFYFKSSRYEVFYLLYSVTYISLVKCNVLELIYKK